MIFQIQEHRAALGYQQAAIEANPVEHQQVLDQFQFCGERPVACFSFQTSLIKLMLVGETTGGGFETLGGDKTHCFISRTKAYNYLTQKLNTIHALSLSL
jgi:hypothetical protein